MSTAEPIDEHTYATNSNAFDIVEDLEAVDFASARAEAAEACRHPFLAAIRPRANTAICTRPHRDMVRKQKRTKRGLYLPERTAPSMRREYGFVCTVLRAGEGFPVEPGTMIVAAQFAGIPLMDTATGFETDLWLLGENDVLATLVEPIEDFE